MDESSEWVITDISAVGTADHSNIDITSSNDTCTGTDTGSTWGGSVPTAPEPFPEAHFKEFHHIRYHSLPQKEERHMRALYRITVVDPKSEAIAGEYQVVAQNEEQALLKANLVERVRKNPEKYDFCVEVVGSVRAKRETQRVKMVKDEE